VARRDAIANPEALNAFAALARTLFPHGPAPTPLAGQPRPEIVETMARISARTLGLDRVAPYDDFFALGGTSLRAMRLLARIEREFGLALPLATFFDGRATVARMAAAIESAANGADEFRRTVPGQLLGITPALFFVYPNEESMLTLRHFTRALGPRHRVVGLLPDRKGARFDPSRSIEDLSAGILRTIRETQPAGPYHIAGFSMGGLLAYEVASQLRASQEEVAWLSLLDTPVPAFSLRRMRRRLSLPQRFARQRERGLIARASTASPSPTAATP
jgi:acyl carrier protein